MSTMSMKDGNLTMAVSGMGEGVARGGNMDRDGEDLVLEAPLLLEDHWDRDSCVAHEWRGAMYGWRRWRC